MTLLTTLAGLLTALLTALLTSGCGLAAQVRPDVVDVWPSCCAPVIGPIRSIRATYNMPVTVLNPYDAQVYADGVLLGTTAIRDPASPNSILLLIAGELAFPQGATFSVNLTPGIVINDQRHYSDADYAWAFHVAPERSLPVTRPGVVTLFDPNTLAVDAGTPTPAGREPIAAMRTATGGVERIWVQLDNGNAGGEALAYYGPGDGVMTVVTLTTSGGDLSCTAGALLLGAAGRWVYAAYRDVDAGRVRVAKVDASTGLETASLLLESVPADAATSPAGLALQYPEPVLLVSAYDGATGTLALVDLEGFVELDQDDTTAGLQGIALADGAGPVAYSVGLANVAPPGSNDLTSVRLLDKAVSTSTSTIVGSSAALLRSRDRGLMIQPLLGYADGLAVTRRTFLAGFTDPVAFEVSDDIAGVSTGATDAVIMQDRAGTPGFVMLLDTPTGLIMTTWIQIGAVLIQQDLDPTTEGVQAVSVESRLSGATSIGRTYAGTEL